MPLFTLLLCSGVNVSAKVSRDQIISWLELSADAMARNREHLTALDSPIGDADHGNNMDRGYKEILNKLDRDETDIGVILKTAAMALISKVGGAAGPLYGTMFLQASKALSEKTELSAEDIEMLLRQSVDGVIMRGHAHAGEKTILDSLIPAMEAFCEQRLSGGTLEECLSIATSAAEQGMKDTIPMIATKGRASYLGERSKGHQDPGATSTYLIIQALQEALVPKEH